MPTVLFQDGFRVMIYTADHRPPHVHVHKAGCTVTVWLDGLAASENEGFSQKELRKVLALVEQHQDELLEHWRQIHG